MNYSANITIHAFRPRIIREFPTNGNSITIEQEHNGAESLELTFYFADIDEWWSFRTAIKKSESNYQMYCLGDDDISDPFEADEAALEHYRVNSTAKGGKDHA